MFKTDNPWDRVEGIAVAVPQRVIQNLDEHYIDDFGFTKKEFYVKPSDLGPLYRPPFKAVAYLMIAKQRYPYNGGNPSLDEFKRVAYTIYMHNKL